MTGQISVYLVAVSACCWLPTTTLVQAADAKPSAQEKLLADIDRRGEKLFAAADRNGDDLLAPEEHAAASPAAEKAARQLVRTRTIPENVVQQLPHLADADDAAAAITKPAFVQDFRALVKLARIELKQEREEALDALKARKQPPLNPFQQAQQPVKQRPYRGIVPQDLGAWQMAVGQRSAAAQREMWVKVEEERRARRVAAENEAIRQRQLIDAAFMRAIQNQEQQQAIEQAASEPQQKPRFRSMGRVR